MDLNLECESHPDTRWTRVREIACKSDRDSTLSHVRNVTKRTSDPDSKRSEGGIITSGSVAKRSYIRKVPKTPDSVAWLSRDRKVSNPSKSDANLSNILLKVESEYSDPEVDANCSPVQKVVKTSNSDVDSDDLKNRCNGMSCNTVSKRSRKFSCCPPSCPPFI